MPGLGVSSGSLQPAGDGRLGVTGEADHDGKIEAFGQEPQHHLDLFGIGFEIVQGRAFAHGEGLVAGLTAQFSDGLSLVDPAKANEGVNVGIGDPAVLTTRMGASITRGINRFLASAGAFTFRPGHDRVGVREANQVDTGLATNTIAGRFGFPGTGEAVFAALPQAA